MDHPAILRTALTSYAKLPHPLHILDTSTSPWEVMCGIILSAATTDAAVNAALPGFLAKYPTPETVVAASKDDMIALLPAIAHTGGKCDYIKNWANYLIQHRGQYSTSIGELTQLQGIGRKTAGIFLWVLAKKDESFPLDTHCLRVLERLGWYAATTPKALEKLLLTEFPEGTRNLTHRMLTQFGRLHCTYRNPQCATCPLRAECKFFGNSAATT